MFYWVFFFFVCRYETGNGIFAEERGVMLNKGTEDEANSVVGSYRYVSPEGVPIEVTYTAGVDGFRAYGAHLPVSPPAGPSLPKSLAYKNAAPSAFARPSQLRTLDDSEPSAAVSTGTPPDASAAPYQSTSDVPASYQPTPEAPVPYQPTPEVPVAYRPTPEVPAAYQPTPEPASSNQVQSQGSFVAASQTATPEIDEVGRVAATANDAAAVTAVQGQAQQVLYVGGSAGGSGSTEKPLLQEPVRVVPLPDEPVRQRLQDSFVRPEYYQQGLSAAVPAVPKQVRPTEKFEPVQPSTVPVLQAQSVVVPARPKVVPALQRVAYQPQQPQQLYGAGPAVPAAQAVDRQQQPGSYRQFSIEPQQMWYVPPYQQQGRYLQTGPVKRTLEQSKYN